MINPALFVINHENFKTQS